MMTHPVPFALAHRLSMGTTGTIGQRGVTLSFVSKCAFVCAVLLGCFAVAASQQTITAFVSILPQQAMVERLGGNLCEVSVLVPPGRSPATYSVTPRQMIALGRADIFFRIGVPYEEALMPKIRANCPNLRIVDLRQGVSLRKMEGAHTHHAEHDEADHGDHSHGAADPHFWLDPMRMKAAVQTVAKTFTELLPEEESRIQQRMRDFSRKLDATHDQLRTMLEPVRGRALYVYHPAFGYFAEAYGLRQRPIEIGGKSPGARHVHAIMREMRAEGVKALFVQPQFSTQDAEAIARETGARVIELDPLAGDYLKNLQRMAQAILRGLSDG